MSVTFDNSGGKNWILFKLDYEIDRFNFEEVLIEILKEFKEEEVNFVGWLEGEKVISISKDNYVITPGEDRIKLRLTKSKMVKVHDKRKALYEKYSKMLEDLK